jgi:O-antigen/teichoic acid export membrane protein
MKSNFSNPSMITSTISLGAFSVFSMVLGLVGTVIITRHYSPEEFGVYTLVLVFVSFMCQISAFGLELSVSKFIAGSKDEFSRECFFNTSVITRISTILFAGLISWYGNPLLKMLFGQALIPSFMVYVPLLFAVDSFRALLKATLQGCLLFPKMGIVESIASLINLFFILMLVYMVKGDMTWLILARAFSSFLACIYAFFSIPIKKRFSFKVDAFKELIRLGFPIQINDILGFVFNRIDTIAVAAFLGPAQIASYEVARKIPDYLRNLYDPFRSVYFPFLSKRYDLEGRQRAGGFMNDAIRFVAFITIFGLVIATLFGREIVQFVFSEKYLTSVPIFILLMFNLSIALISNVMGTSLVAIGDSKKPMVINFFNAVFSWLGTIIFIPAYALLGAGIANTVGTVVALPLNRYFLRKRIELNDMLYLKPVFLFCIWGLLVYIIKPESLLIKFAFLIAFMLACIFLSIITKDDIFLLMEWSRLNSYPPFMRLVTWVSKL